MGMDMNALLAAASKKAGEKRKNFEPLELIEGNVQAIFNRCLAKEGTSEENISKSLLFSRTLGYKPSDEIVMCFDKQKILDNQLNIKYLYGQLKAVHQKSDRLSIESAFYTYSGKPWTTDKAHLLELLYLGGTRDILLIVLLNAEDGSAPIATSTVKPTLSPKDPNFSAWWEAHKGEWEA